jgi:hypothetical protein
MTCERSIELMIEVLYGEVDQPRLSFEFFEHLSECTKCRQEYIELVETREMLAEWEPEEVAVNSQSVISTPRPRLVLTWWPLLQKVAAGLLIAVGAYSVLQMAGLLPAHNSFTVSEAQLTEVIHDVTLARQVEDWRVIGEALLNLKEELDATNRLEIRAVYEDMQDLEQRYVHALEESNRHVKSLLNR